MNRSESMKKAISEAESFCNKYDTAPYGNSFNDFRNITVQKFFDSIYQNSLEEQVQGLQSLLDLKQQKISVLESKVGELQKLNEKQYTQFMEAMK